MKPFLLFATMILIVSCNPKPIPEILSLEFEDVQTTEQVGAALAVPPDFTARLSNPQIVNNTYTVDVEFISNVEGKEIYASNFRFWYDSKDFTNVVRFKNFQGSYSTYLPTLSTGITPVFILPKWYANWFNFTGDAVFVNGSFGLRAPATTPIILSSRGWTKLLQIELVKTGTDLTPELVLDLEADPLRGGYLPGSSGIVLTVVNGTGSSPISEHALQFNWAYSGTGLVPPYGGPIN